MNMHKPELLCPAGSPRALEAAIEGGADAVYLGGTLFNARINADNFDDTVLPACVKLAHTYGVKVYLTLNTEIYDRELNGFLEAAHKAAAAGVDALIVADAGAAGEIHKRIPNLPLHASTQMSCHNADACKTLADLGYSRVVLARELSLENVNYAVTHNPLDIEIFVHGALCVSQSGQCLFSSMVGGRSGNRGECAQPCRLPYSSSAFPNKVGYPLSLKDLSLAEYVPELIKSGVSSLKIEGRMKSPEYVLGVSKIWRKLLDENRAASPDEMKELREFFSRGGFTDGYFTDKISHSMMGVRSDSDKQSSRELTEFKSITRKIPIDVSAVFKSYTPTSMTVTGKNGSVTVNGDTPQAALNRPMSRDDVIKNLSKFGNTPYTSNGINLDFDEGLILNNSALNALRRAAVTEYDKLSPTPLYTYTNANFAHPAGQRTKSKTARFHTEEQITSKAADYFDILYLPLREFIANNRINVPESKLGVIMPPIVYDSEYEKIKSHLEFAKSKGAKHILVGNIGAIRLAKQSGLEIHGDYRFNVCNGTSVALLEKLGVPDVIASPELTVPQLKGLAGNTSAIVYGRIPLMTLEKCAVKEIAGCDKCKTDNVALRDRKGIDFPILREPDHRNIVYNSLPTSMSDKQNELRFAGITALHFIFSIESKTDVDKVIGAFENGVSIGENVRRISAK